MDASIDRCLKIISIAVTCLFLCTGLLADTAGDFELAIFIKNEPKPLDQVLLRELCSGLTQNLQKQSSPQTKLGIFSIKKCSSESVPLPVNYTLLVSISNDTTLIELIRKSKSKKNVVLYKRNIENFTKDTAAAYRQKVLELLSLDIMFSLPIQALAALRDDRPISNLILDRNGLLQKVLQSLKKEVYLQQTYWSSVQKRWQVAHAVEAEIRLSLVDGDQLQFSFVAKRAVRVLDRKQSYFLSLGENLPVIREKISQKLKSLLDQKLSHLRLPSEVEANADDGSDNLTDEQAVELVSAEQSASSADESDFIDMNVGLFRRWYDDAPFTLEGLLLTSEWSFPEIPVRLGPTMRYSKIESLDGYYNDGQLLDFSLRVTTFMDFEHILPYIAVDYTLGGLGTLRANQREGNIEESGTVDFKSTGFDIILGASFFWSNVGVFFETTAYANHKIDLAGNITRATIADSGAIDFTVLQPEDYSNKTFLSFALGMSVEL